MLPGSICFQMCHGSQDCCPPAPTLRVFLLPIQVSLGGKWVSPALSVVPPPNPQKRISPRNLLNTLNQAAWDLVTILPGLTVLYTHVQFNKYRVQVYQSQLNKYGVYGVCTYAYKNLGTGILVRNVVSVITLFLGKNRLSLHHFYLQYLFQEFEDSPLLCHLQCPPASLVSL